MDANYYQILGVDEHATNDEIKKAYKKLALKVHPDHHNNSAESNQKFKEVLEAFEVLSDSHKRAIYDRYREESFKGKGHKL